MKIFSFILWFVSLLLYLWTPTEIKSEFLILCLIEVLGVLILYLLYTHKDKKLQKNYFRPSVLFIISFFIVSFQVSVDYILGNLSLSDLDKVLLHADLINKCVSISLLGLTSLFSGYIYFTESKVQKKNVSISYHFNKYINLFLILGSYIMFFLFIANVGKEYLSGHYAGSSNWGTGAGLYNKFFEAFVYACFIYKFYCNKTYIRQSLMINIYKYLMFIGFPLLFVMISYILLVFYIGDRGPLISFMLLLSIGYVIKYQIKVKFVSLIIAIFLFANILFFIGITRNTDNIFNFSIRERYNELEHKPSISPFTSELAGSIFPLSIALDVVPTKLPYKYGLYQTNQVMITFPGLFGIYITILGYDKINDDYFYDSARFLTRIYLGKYPSYGIGSNCIADFYLDFGIVGVVIGMFLFGLFLRKMDLALNPTNFKNLSLFSAVLFFVYFSKLIYIPRSTVLAPFSDSIIVYIILLIISKLSTRKI